MLRYWLSEILVLVILCHYQASAQKGDTLVVNGMVILNSGSLPSTSVKLNPYIDGQPTYDTYLNSNGSFEFKIPVTEAVLYEVRYGGYSKSILFTKAERSVGFTIYVKDSKPAQMFISNSPENIACENFRTFHLALRDSLKGFKTECTTNSSACIKHWTDLFATHNLHLQQLTDQFPQTFTAAVLAPLSKVPTINTQQPLLAQLQKHYFDAANFTDMRLFTTPDIATKFIGYLDHIADTSRQARLTFIADMFAKTMGNTAAQKKVGLALYNLFTKTNREKYLQSMEEWLDKQPWANEELPVIMARLKLASKVLPGSKAPEVAGLDEKGKQQSLSSITKNGKLTMVLFWSSDCFHCRESMPEFIRLYEKYHPKGLNVLAASLDTDSKAWKQFIADNHLPWTNINISETNPAYTAYFIQATPSIALVDSKGLIVHRFMDVKDLESQIDTVLK